MSYELQFFAVALTFTGLGWYFGCQWMAKRMATFTVNSLIADGFLRYRLDDNGETEILKWNYDMTDEDFDNLLTKLKNLKVKDDE